MAVLKTAIRSRFRAIWSNVFPRLDFAIARRTVPLPTAAVTLTLGVLAGLAAFIFFATPGTANDDIAALRTELTALLDTQQASMDHMWTMTAAALVFLMQAGFLLLEAGLVRSKNSINVAQKNIADFVIATVGFYLVGFGFMFGPSLLHGWIGWGGLGFGQVDDWHYTFFVFQLVFCGTAATIVSGAVAERMKFNVYLYTTTCVSVLIYPLFGHWAWGNLLLDQPAFLADQGFIDFAGSTVVHSIGGWVALAGCIVIGPRIGRYDEQGRLQPINGHSAVLATVGAILLWVGWIGFNGGSTTVGTPDFAHIISNTMLAAAFGGITSMIVGRFQDKLFRPDRSINGVLAGLVAITAGCDAVSTHGAIIIGVTAGVVVIYATSFLEHVLKVDDAIGAIPVHGVCGAWGTILAGALALPDKMGTETWIGQVLVQMEGVALAFVWAFGVAYVLFRVLDATIGLRVSRDHELEGLNVAEHGTTLGTGMLQRAMMDLATGSGDLSHRLDDSTGDESGELAGSFNLLMERLQVMVLSVASNARVLLESSVSLRSVSDGMSQDSVEMTKRAGHVASLTDTVATRVSTMSKGVGNLNENVLDIADSARSMSSRVVEASDNVDRITQAVTAIAESARSAARTAANASERAHTAGNTMRDLSDAVGEITTIVDAIRAIAGQTRLLALNASIEAARAGDAGRGFQVVASEVKTLADQAGTAAEDIARRIEAVRSGTGSAVSVIKDVSTVIAEVNGAVDRIDSAVSAQTRSAEAISGDMTAAADEARSITGAIDSVSETARKVSFDAREAAQETHSVFHIVGQVNAAAKDSMASAHRVQEASSEVFRIANEMETMVGRLGGTVDALDRADKAATRMARLQEEDAV